MAEDLGTLVAAEFALLIAVNARDRADLMQALPVDGELIQTAIALSNLEGWKAQLRPAHFISSVSIQGAAGEPAMWPFIIW